LTKTKKEILGGRKMPVYIICTIENVEKYTGKNGFGANVMVSTLQDKKRKTLSFNIKSAEHANILEDHLQREVTLIMSIEQNNFGTRIGELVSITPNNIFDQLNKKVS
jgi:hypothetical protein